MDVRSQYVSSEARERICQVFGAMAEELERRGALEEADFFLRAAVEFVQTDAEEGPSHVWLDVLLERLARVVERRSQPVVALAFWRRIVGTRRERYGERDGRTRDAAAQAARLGLARAAAGTPVSSPVTRPLKAEGG